MTPTDSFARSKAWLLNRALPLWSTVGREPSGGFHERLDLTGVPDVSAPRRAMVQARQIAVFSLAHDRGWIDARDIVGPAVDHLIRTYHGRDGRPGWLFSVDGAGAPIDSRRDTYTHAFMLFALGWARAVLDDPRLTTLADQTLAAMDDLMAASPGGYRDAEDAAAEPLRQNPHMHLIEALTVLSQHIGKADYRARADAVYAMFTGRFLLPGVNVLNEMFDAQWRAPPLEQAVWEPGHHFEWVWLLHRYAGVSGQDVGAAAAALYDTAWSLGIDGEGLTVDEVSGDGRVLKASRRCWPQTETVKAHAAEHEAGRPGCRERAAAALHNLLDRYLAGPVDGGWIEHLDGEGKPMRNDIPASSLYHIGFAIAEADRVFGG